MKLLLKIFTPLFFILILVFVSTSYFSISVFKKTYFENKAITLGDHALREVSEVFNDEDFNDNPDSDEIQRKIKIFIKAIEEPSTFRVRVWSREGRIIYSNTKNNEEGKLFDKSIQDGFLQIEPVSWSVKTPRKDEMDVGYGEYLNVIIPMRNSNGETKYVLDRHVATSGILADVHKLLNQSTYLLFASGLIIFIAFYILLRIFITAPIRGLLLAMGMVAQGKLDFEYKSTSNDEIGELVRQFDNMRLKIKEIMSQLQDSKDELEKKNNLSQDQVEELEKFKQLVVGRELKMIELKEKIKELESKHVKSDKK